MSKKLSKYGVARICNAILCLALLIIIMRAAYNTWSMYGQYTLYSFLVSLFIHGTLSGMIYFGIDYLLRKFMTKDVDFNKQFSFSEDDCDVADAWFSIFFMNQQSRNRNETWIQTKPNQRSEQGQNRINLLKEQAEDIEYEEVHC